MYEKVQTIALMVLALASTYLFVFERLNRYADAHYARRVTQEV